MGKILLGIILFAGGFGLSFIDKTITTWIGLTLMVVGVFLLCWGFTKIRPKKKGK